MTTWTGAYFRKGRCEECGGSAERSKSFTGESRADVDRQAAEWRGSPLRHKRCEENEDG